MTLWDILILVLGAALIVEGLWKGAVRLGFGLAGLLAGYLYAGYAAAYASKYLTFLVENLRRPVALAGGFLLIFAVFVLAGAVVSKLVKSAGLGCVNRVLGAVLGVIATIYAAGGLVHLSARLSPEYPQKITQGPVMRLLSEWALGMEALIPPLKNAAPPAIQKPFIRPPEAPKPNKAGTSA